MSEYCGPKQNKITVVGLSTSYPGKIFAQDTTPLQGKVSMMKQIQRAGNWVL